MKSVSLLSLTSSPALSLSEETHKDATCEPSLPTAAASSSAFFPGSGGWEAFSAPTKSNLY